jgi:hypothetical protein
MFIVIFEDDETQSLPCVFCCEDSQVAYLQACKLALENTCDMAAIDIMKLRQLYFKKEYSSLVDYWNDYNDSKSLIILEKSFMKKVELSFPYGGRVIVPSLFEEEDDDNIFYVFLNTLLEYDGVEFVFSDVPEISGNVYSVDNPSVNLLGELIEELSRSLKELSNSLK